MVRTPRASPASSPSRWAICADCCSDKRAALRPLQRGAAGFEDFANEPGAWVRVAGDGGVRPGVARFDQPYAESALLTPCDDAISAFAPDGIARHRIDRRPDLYAALRGP